VRDVKTRKNTAKPLKEITPNTNDADKYQHDDVQVHRTTQTSGRGTNKSLDKSNDMSKLFDKNRNAINNITTLQRYPQKIKTGGVQGIHKRDHSEI
jgi:hypothetical protein